MNDIELTFAAIAGGIIIEVIAIIVWRYYSNYKQHRENELFDTMHNPNELRIQNAIIESIRHTKETQTTEIGITEFHAPEWFPCPVVQVSNMSYDDAFTQIKAKYQKVVPVVIGSGEFLFDDWEEQITLRDHDYNTAIEKSNAHYSFLNQKYPESYSAEYEFQYPSIDKTLKFDAAESIYFIALVPVDFPWQALAYLNFGEWNECPSCEFCTALMRVWEEKNGIKVWFLKPDTIKIILPDNSKTKNIKQLSIDAVNLNPEHHTFESEGVPSEQSLQQMESEFSTNKNITFWWD